MTLANRDTIQLFTDERKQTQHQHVHRTFTSPLFKSFYTGFHHSPPQIMKIDWMQDHSSYKEPIKQGRCALWKYYRTLVWCFWTCRGKNPLSTQWLESCMPPTRTLSIMSVKEQYEGFRWQSTYSARFKKWSLSKQRCRFWHTNVWHKSLASVGTENHGEFKHSSCQTTTVIFFSFLLPWRETTETTQATPNWIWEKGGGVTALFISVLCCKIQATLCTTARAMHR